MKTTDKKLNIICMELLSDMKPCNDASRLFSEEDKDKTAMQSVALNRAIDAFYMQNKILEQIDMLKDKSCFMTDNEGVITLLKGLLVGNEENM